MIWFVWKENHPGCYVPNGYVLVNYCCTTTHTRTQRLTTIVINSLAHRSVDLLGFSWSHVGLAGLAFRHQVQFGSVPRVSFWSQGWSSNEYLENVLSEVEWQEGKLNCASTVQDSICITSVSIQSKSYGQAQHEGTGRVGCPLWGCGRSVDLYNTTTWEWRIGNNNSENPRGQEWKFGDFPGGAVVKNPPANVGDMGLIPGVGRCHMPWSN